MRKATHSKAVAPRTLCIDIGGTGLKSMVVSAQGKPLSARAHAQTPHPATPKALAQALKTLVPDPSTYERISVGFPGVVVGGVVKTAPNLEGSWGGFNLAQAMRKHAHKPTRVLNDAGVQGHGVIRGKGVEVCITLGTGLGFALFVNGFYVPNIELAHHPFRKGKTYEEELGDKALARLGRRKWNRMVARAVDLIDRTFNYDALYIGGGNSTHLTVALPPDVRKVSNIAGLLGGVKLWERSSA